MYIKSLHKVSPSTAPQHCACITQGPSKDSRLIAFYQGAECTDEQHVVVEHHPHGVGGGKVRSVHLHARSGNPVLFHYASNIYLMESTYVPPTNPLELAAVQDRPVRRWMHCKTTIHRIELLPNGDPTLVDPVYLPQLDGLLGRISPLWASDDRLLMPLYRERDPLCVTGLVGLTEDKSITITVVSEFGDQVPLAENERYSGLGLGVTLQPSFFHIRPGVIGAVCRSAVYSTETVRGKKAYTFSSEDGGNNWQYDGLSRYTSNNSSILCIDTPYGHVVVHNDIQSGRSSLRAVQVGHYSDAVSLGTVKPAHVKKSLSYPNALACGSTLEVVYTDNKSIACAEICLSGESY